jgi:hypothetical protein
MKISVTATIFSQTATAEITQTNINASGGRRSAYVPPEGSPNLKLASTGGHSFPWKKVLIIAGVAAAGAAAYLYLSRTTKPSATISAGSGSVTAP